MIVRGSSWRLVVPSSSPKRRQQRAQRGGEQQAAAMPTIDAPMPIAKVSASTDRSTWRARGAERAQQRELLRALRDGDREGVEDQEAADQQRDAGEHEQRDADEAERVREVLRGLLGLLLAGADGEVLGAELAC